MSEKMPFGANTLVIPFTGAPRRPAPRSRTGMSRMRPAGELFRHGVVQTDRHSQANAPEQGTPAEGGPAKPPRRTRPIAGSRPAHRRRRAPAARHACPARRRGRASSMTSRSIRAIVDSRCAIAITVRPCISDVELLLDRRLDLAVQRRGRLVQHQDRRVLQDHPGDGDPLALAAGQLDPALADMRVVAAAAVPILEPEDELVRVRPPRRVLHLRIRRARPAVADVVA